MPATSAHGPGWGHLSPPEVTDRPAKPGIVSDLGIPGMPSLRSRIGKWATSRAHRGGAATGRPTRARASPSAVCQRISR